MDKVRSHYEGLADESVASGLGKPEIPERRRGNRHLTTLRIAKLSTLKAEGLGIVRNASAGGMMIDAYLTFVPGEQVTIHLSNEQQVEGRVVWHASGMTGVQFAEPVDIDSVLARPGVLGNGRSPRPPRLDVDRRADLESRGLRISGQVCDVSQRGVKVALQDKLETGDPVTVVMDGFRPLSGSVRWRKGDQAGIIFHEPIAITELMEWANGAPSNEQ